MIRASFRAATLVFCMLMPGFHAGAVVSETTYLGFPAYRITDGRTEAVIVPELAGRVMAYRFVNERNLIYNIDERNADNPGVGFVNWGGDKTLIGPHGLWWTHAESIWPPKPTWMSLPHEAEMQNNGASLRTVGPAWEGFNIRVIRVYEYNDSGDLLIHQTLEMLAETPIQGAIWNVSQVIEPDRVNILSSPESIYVDGHVCSNPHRNSMPVGMASGNEFEVTFRPGRATKISFDSPVATLAAQWENTVWVQRGALTEGANLRTNALRTFPVELYTQGRTENNYVELELMSPGLVLKKGAPVTFTLSWSLHIVEADTHSLLQLLSHPQAETAQ